MKYSKLSKTSKCIIASTLLTGATIAAVTPILTTTYTTNTKVANEDQKIQTGKIIHSANTRVVNNINEINIESVNALTVNANTYSHNAIVNNNGVQEVYVWGANDFGQLGIGNKQNQSSPVKLDLSVFGQYSTIELNIANNNAQFSYALVDYGMGKELYTWGRNELGQLGIGDTTDQVIPFSVNKSFLGNYDSVQFVRAEFQSLYVITLKNGQQQLFSSGRNTEGQLGIGNSTNQNSFQLVTPARLGNYISIDKFTVNGYAVSALIRTINGIELYVWGENAKGQLGTSGSTNINSPTKHTNAIFNSANIANVEYNFGRNSSYALNRKTNQLFTWGANAYGQLGLGGTDTSNRTSPVLVSASSLGGGIITEINVDTYSSYAKVLVNNSELRIYVWGRNSEGQLGNGNTTNQLTPISFNMANIGNATSIQEFKISNSDWNSSYSSYAIISLNNRLELYVWGRNNFGQLNNGNTTNVLVPQRMTMPNNMRLVNARIKDSLWLQLVDQTGKNRYYVMGRNDLGQLALGNTTTQTTLTEILPIRNTNFLNKNMTSTLSSTEALNLFRNDTAPNYTQLRNFIDFIDVPANTRITINNLSSADFNSGLMELIFSSSLTYPLLSNVVQTTNTEYTLWLKFTPVNDIDSTPIAAFSTLPTGLGDAQNFYRLIVDANNNVINRPLLSKYVNLSSIPQNASLSITKRPVQNDTYKLDFTVHTNMVYKNGGIQTLEDASFNIIINLPYINYGLILGISIPVGILLILLIVFGSIYNKRNKNSRSTYLRRKFK